MPLRTETAHVAYPSLTDTLADRLLRKIEDEKLMPGDYVATEGALAEEFGVSVRVLREAVARLRGLGILRAKQGVGLLVARPEAIEQVKKAHPNHDFSSLFQAGMSVGRDVMGTMSNTLILAYTGSALPLLLLMMANKVSFLKIINLEMIATEIVRALAGSIGLVLCIPVTAFVSALLYFRECRR